MSRWLFVMLLLVPALARAEASAPATEASAPATDIRTTAAEPSAPVVQANMPATPAPAPPAPTSPSATLTPEPWTSGGAGYGMIGVRSIDLGALTSRLEDAGFSTPDQSFLSIGGGGHAMLGRFIIGGEGHGLLPMGSKAANGGDRISIGGAYGLGRIGYVVLRTDRFQLYPLVGIGGGGISVHHDGTRPLGAVVPGAGVANELSTGGLLLDGSVAADFRVLFSHSATSEGFMLIGLRAGYTFAPVTGDWQVDGRNMGGGPDLGITGPSVRLVIGAGGQSTAP